MTGTRRPLIARTVFVLDVLVCGIWAYWAATSMLRTLSATGSGGIAGVSVSGGVLEGLYTVVPPIVTLLLTRASGASRLAKYWRNAHLAVVLALIIVPMMGSLRVMMVSIVVLLPVQLFFVVGAIAIWIVRPRPRPDSPSEASS